MSKEQTRILTIHFRDPKRQPLKIWDAGLINYTKMGTCGQIRTQGYVQGTHMHITLYESAIAWMGVTFE